ncbi:MAG: pectate lyase, partial [Chitinophagaceae bacterium]|nr:pectate lyase [Chitinophagaceae bacterium]
VEGNYVDGAPDVTKNNIAGVHPDPKGTEEEKKTVVQTAAFPTVPITIQSAEDAYKAVLLQVGASFKRDTMDARIINNVIDRTGKIIDVQGGYPHHSAFEITGNAWPVLKSYPAPADTDKDGMPDEWEKKNGLDANDANDASQYKLDKQYTNIEVYINSLLKAN